MPELCLSDSYVVRTQHKRERWAAENIARAGYAYYLPQIMETIRVVTGGRRRREFRAAPLFPSYIFVQADGRWHGLLNTFGVVGVVPGSGGEPALIRSSALSAIRGLEVNGVVQLPVLQTGFQPNQRARIMRGSYAGYTGIVQGNSGSERVSVLLDYMGRKVPFLVREADLEAA